MASMNCFVQVARCQAATACVAEPVAAAHTTSERTTTSNSRHHHVGTRVVLTLLPLLGERQTPPAPARCLQQAVRKVHDPTCHLNKVAMIVPSEPPHFGLQVHHKVAFTMVDSLLKREWVRAQR